MGLINPNTAPHHRGIITFIKNEPGKFFGFIRPDFVDPVTARRRFNVWFGKLATNGETFEVGDIVDYVLHDRDPQRLSETAFRIWKTEEGKQK
jgi:hypothetical protein